MHIRWKKRQTVSMRQRGERLCTHTHLDSVLTISPVLMEYEQGKQRYVWRIGPYFRTCCQRNPMARASWWAEVMERFEDLDTPHYPDQTLARGILTLKATILEEVAIRIPPPTKRQTEEYARSRKPGVRRSQLLLPKEAIEALELVWPFTLEQVKQSYRTLARKHHPDRGGDGLVFGRISKAYNEITAFLEKKSKRGV